MSDENLKRLNTGDKLVWYLNHHIRYFKFYKERVLQELLNHPAIQSGLAPFVAALLVAELLQRLRLSGLSIIAGFAATVFLASNFSVDPLTASRKIVWLGIAASMVGVLLAGFNLSGVNGSVWRPVLSILSGAAAIWVGLPILQHQALNVALQWGVGCALFVTWLVFWMDGLHDTSVRAGSAGMALGLGAGGAALLGGSGLLGQFGLAVGAAAGAYLMIQMVGNRRLPCGRSYTLPLSLITGLVACVAVLTTQLPWYALIPLAVIPLAAKIPVSEKLMLWVQSLLLSAATLSCAATAVYLTWRVAGAPPF